MKRSEAVLSVLLIVLLGSQWLLPSHLEVAGMVRPVPAHSEHSHSSSSTVTPLQHHCCEQDGGAPSLHGHLCCGACPGLPSAIADFASYTPYLPLTLIEPQEKGFSFLASLWHPPLL
jgi:hypothetical protein